MLSATPTPESLKKKAKVIRKFLNEKYSLDISHGHCMELISQLFGFKDWNTAKAEISAFERLQVLASIRARTTNDDEIVKGMTVGEIRKALEGCDDSATVDADFEFSLGEFINSLEELANPEDTIHQEFAVTAIEKFDENYANIKLTLNYENLSTS
ncbi:MAG: hypothetical protein A2X86_00505 [Bdellovibrionales bacterium GWA2_49_15]|nr:MAG: hypothetical protein A2X86_00505 [Bdellovibrionales bacterium GWA2_49_15]HAZ13253.1 hypothetical protein [Bdellovibrionales bacterium]